MPATTVKRSSTKSAQKSAKTTTPTEPAAAPAPVEQHTETDTTSVEQTESDISAVQAEIAAHIDMIRQCQSLLQNLIKGTRTTAANVKRLERENKRLDKKSRRSKENRASNGNKGLQQLKPVYTQEMRSFFESNKDLTDGDGAVIVENLTYDSDNLLASRKQALKLVTSYIRAHNLKDETNKRKINMDSTLQGLFPELCAVKDKKGKVTQEENCYYNTLMAALSRHFQSS